MNPPGLRPYQPAGEWTRCLDRRPLIVYPERHIERAGDAVVSDVMLINLHALCYPTPATADN